MFSVTDSGIGIAPEHVPRLTERFYRVDRSRSRETGGTGLGLAIVKHVLLRHQAELDVMSELGQGSTFTVILPAPRVRRAPAPESGVDRSPSGAERRRLPVAERGARTATSSRRARRRPARCGSPGIAARRRCASASRCDASKPSAARPFGIAVARISSITRVASTSPASSARSRRACRAPRQCAPADGAPDSKAR